MADARAKFRVAELTQKQMLGGYNGVGTVVKLVPVVGGSEENDNFYHYTPSGMIELGLIREDAAEVFPIGAEVYVDFTRADN